MKKSTRPILIIASPAQCPDLVYKSEFWAPDPIVFMLTPEKRYLVVSRLEIGRAQALAEQSTQSPPIEVMTPDALKVPRSARRGLDTWALYLLKHAGVTDVDVSHDFPHGAALRLKKAGMTVNVKSGNLFPERMVKTEKEIARITESQRAAVNAMNSAIDMIAGTRITRDGYLLHKQRRLTSEQVQQHIHQILLAHESFCGDAIVAGGAQGADPHERGHGPLKAHTPIVIDIFPQHMRHGYGGDLTRTVLRGKASSAHKRMYAAVKAAQTEALKCIKPRVKCGTVHQTVVDTFKARKYETTVRDGTPVGFFHGTGHGIGLAIHEGPSLAPSQARLKAGHVVTVEPGLYYPELGGVRIEDTVAVTAKGYKMLVACPKRFEV